MIKKIRHTFIIGILFVSFATFAISQVDQKVVNDIYAQIELFSYALTMIQSEYVEKKTPQELIYGSLRGMLSSLDPHSLFMDPDEYKELKNETSGKFGGLGIEISIRDGLLTVITPIEDTPAWNAGVKAGDRIVKIEDELTKDMTLSDAVKKLRGDPGTEINITVLRESEFKILDFKIVREIIKIKDIKYPQILEDNIAYVRLAEFRENSAKELRKAVNILKEAGADSLILDLRNNPGGLLYSAIDITDFFIPRGEMIVSTRGRHKDQDMETYSQGSNAEKILDWPIVVLINKGSASGSEILAGALKDNKRAVILGEQSFGKGSVQSVLPLPDGSGLRLTTSKYFTPSGVCIHGIGIKPDIIVERIYVEEDEHDKKDKELEDLFDKVELKSNGESGELTEEKKIENEFRAKLLEDNQVQSAISVLKGIKVYKNLTEDNASKKSDKVTEAVEPLMEPVSDEL